MHLFCLTISSRMKWCDNWRCYGFDLTMSLMQWQYNSERWNNLLAFHEGQLPHHMCSCFSRSSWVSQLLPQFCSCAWHCASVDPVWAGFVTFVCNEWILKCWNRWWHNHTRRVSGSTCQVQHWYPEHMVITSNIVGCWHNSFPFCFLVSPVVTQFFIFFAHHH